MRLLTKEQREKSRVIQFENLIKRGYIQQTFEDLEIFTAEINQRFYVEIFKGTASHSIVNYCYRTEEERSKAIENCKNFSLISAKRKAEEKASQKLTKQQAEEKAASGETVQADTKKSTQLLKKLIREKFGIQCSVKSSFYSMGCSLDIEYTAGPDKENLRFIKSALQYGRFNSMEDLSYSVDVSGLVVDGFKLQEFKHVFISQQLPESLTLQLTQKLAVYYGLSIPATIEEARATNTELQQNFGAWELTSLLHRNFTTRNFCTQEVEKINVLSCHRLENSNNVYFLYEYNGQQYSTAILPTVEATATPEKPTVKAIAPDTLQILDYSAKAFAIVGNTKPIKEKLKELGGSFNPRLSCGAGWIFSKSKLPAVETFLNTQFSAN